MKTEILKIKGDWEDVVNRCRATVGKAELGHEPSDTFKRKILIAEHSPIRELHISVAGQQVAVGHIFRRHIVDGRRQQGLPPEVNVGGTVLRIVPVGTVELLVEGSQLAVGQLHRALVHLIHIVVGIDIQLCAVHHGTA